MENFLYAVPDGEAHQTEEEGPCYCLAVDEKGPYIMASKDLPTDTGTFIRVFPLEARQYSNQG